MAFDLEVNGVVIEIFVCSADAEQLRQAMNRLAESEAVLGGALASAVIGIPMLADQVPPPPAGAAGASVGAARAARGSVAAELPLPPGVHRPQSQSRSPAAAGGAGGDRASRWVWGRRA